MNSFLSGHHNHAVIGGNGKFVVISGDTVKVSKENSATNYSISRWLRQQIPPCHNADWLSSKGMIEIIVLLEAGFLPLHLASK